jgi:mRNA interferase RelE/StbE
MLEVVYKKRAIKALARMSSADRQRIQHALGQLAQNPRGVSLDTKPLQGRDGFRLRIGDWRVIYELDGEQLVILVLHIGLRGDVYK